VLLEQVEEPGTLDELHAPIVRRVSGSDAAAKTGA
jgi:hypothetical protein